MKLGISLKIDVTKIDKQRLFQGSKGTYLDATIFVDTDNEDQYGNHGFIAQSVTKEERDSNVQGAILGNGKVFWKGESAQAAAYSQEGQGSRPNQAGGMATDNTSGGGDDPFQDIPFSPLNAKVI